MRDVLEPTTPKFNNERGGLRAQHERTFGPRVRQLARRREKREPRGQSIFNRDEFTSQLDIRKVVELLALLGE